MNEWPPWLFVSAENPVLLDVAQEVLGNQELRSLFDTAIGDRFWPVQLQDWSALLQTPGAQEQVSPQAGGLTLYGTQPDSTVGSVGVGIDVDRLHQVVGQDSARARGLVRDAFIHELAHVLPVAQSGHIRDRLHDPQPGHERRRNHPMLQAENRLRGLLNLEPRRQYGLLGD